MTPRRHVGDSRTFATSRSRARSGGSSARAACTLPALARRRRCGPPDAPDAASVARRAACSAALPTIYQQDGDFGLRFIGALESCSIPSSRCSTRCRRTSILTSRRRTCSSRSRRGSGVEVESRGRTSDGASSSASAARAGAPPRDARGPRTRARDRVPRPAAPRSRTRAASCSPTEPRSLRRTSAELRRLLRRAARGGAARPRRAADRAGEAGPCRYRLRVKAPRAERS